MKAKFLFPFVILLLLFTTQCNQKGDGLTGKWRLHDMDINGTKMDISATAVWSWEFSADGKYAANVAGAEEKGKYKFENKKLTLQPLSNRERAEIVFDVPKLDSTHLELTASGKNSTHLWFEKM